MSKKDIEAFGSYVLLEKLAMGGMAEIFLSKSAGAQGIGKFVAIKRILPQFSANEEFIKMFTEEAKLCMNLSHSNIAKIHEFGIEKSQFYIAMELISGRNLRQILTRLSKEGRPGLAVDQCAFIAKEIASGLDYAHRCLDNASGKPLNIIHRDMSPQNVMISYDGEVKVVDFGIAKADKDEGEKTKAGTLKGKFSYMSPEQAGGEELDVRTDVFSLGIVLWEILANKRLFSSPNEMQTLKKIRDCKIPPISKLNPKVPEELERIVNIALARKPDNRYQTCAEFYKDLNRFLNRFYPDFSSHDFSVFVKSLYADDVLNNRNKFIEYSKISSEYKNKKDREEENKKTISNEKVKNIFGDQSEQSKIRLNTKSLILDKSITNIRKNGSQARESTRSRVDFKNDKDLLSPANLSLIALFVVAIGLIVSQLLPSGSGGETLEFALEQPSLVEPRSGLLDTHNMVITSSPSAAEIFIDGKSLGQLTPARVKVPAGREFQLSLKKDGYLNRKISMQSRGNGSKENLSLQKLNTGYLNIYADNKHTLIYLNGKKIKEKTPVKNFRVPAGQSIKIKAVDLKSNRYSTKEVQVKADETLTLRMKPRKAL